MPKYAVPMKTGAFTLVYVEADSPAEAIELADDTPTICAQCSGWGSTEKNSGIEIGDWDIDEDEEPWEVE